jgi:hypothetical protein
LRDAPDTDKRGVFSDITLTMGYRMKLVRCAALASLVMALPISLAFPFAPALAATSVSVAPVAPPSMPPAPTASVDGFRSAHFGMTEADVRKAIGTDFKLSGSAIRSGENPLQHTKVLSISVPGLLPGSGKAAVDYVFGYKSRRLVEVNIRWSAASDPSNVPAMLLRTGATLQTYFQGDGFPANQTAVNAVLANGSILLFRGTDMAGHAVVLILAGQLSRPDKTDKTRRIQMTPTVLSLAYAADPAHPDVFQLQKGAF